MRQRRTHRPAKSDFRLRAEAFVVSAILQVVGRMPHWMTACLVSFLARVLCVVDARHRRTMMRQMRLAFGDRFNDSMLLDLSRMCYRNELLCFVELARLPRIGEEYMRRHVDVADAELGRELKASGRGVLIITGHIGSWELQAHVADLCGYPIVALARPLKNPYLNATLNRFRTTRRNRIREKFDSLRSISQLAQEGNWVCFLYDQNGGPRDAFVPFFGVPAATWRSAPFVHLKFDLPIVVCTLTRENWLGSRFKLNVHKVLHPEESRLREEPELHVLHQIHEGFEEALRSHPEQWLWQHRRWKTRPPGENSRLVDGVPVFD